MRVHFQQIHEDTGSFPQAKLPMLPVLSIGTFVGRRKACYPSEFLSGTEVFASATAALAHAFKALGLGNGVGILVPAYHCGAMIEPAIWLNAEISFYRVKPDLRVDLQDVERRITANTRTLLVAHYFGFPQPLEAIAALSRRYDLTLVEDCAHAFFGQYGSLTLGSIGDIAVASMTKFFPCEGGGLLRLSGGTTTKNQLKEQTPLKQLRAVLNPLELANHHGRLRGLRPFLEIGKRLAKRAHIKGASDVETVLAERSSFRWFDPTVVNYRGCWFPGALLRLSAKRRVATRRRQNYLYLLKQLGGLGRARPLHRMLPEGVVPYVFPLIIDFPEPDFRKLKLEGVPIWRWEELAESDCPVSDHYRLHLLQLPCHQELRRDELEWLSAQVKKILA